MRISDVFAMGGGFNDDPYYDDYHFSSDNPCYSSWPYCESPRGPFYYGPRGDRQGLAHILGSPRDGGGILGILR
jgi:hypothetical protein